MGRKKVDKFKDLPLREQFKPIFKERFLEMLKTEEEYEKLLDYLVTPQKKSFRINSIKEDNPQELVENLKQKGLDIEEVPWCENAYFLNYDKNDKNSRSDLGNLYEHFLGKIYVQEATSMCPVEVLDFPEEIDENFAVLDVAAAPGSKTTQIGDKMNNRGVLVANEIDFKRLGPLKINLERSGLYNIIITNLDGRRIEGEKKFDRIVLDAPCSGSGVIRKSPKTVKTYNPKKLKGMQNLQLQLLRRAFELLKKGGVMTYSTCSMDPEENEFVVQRFLEENENAVLEKAELKGLVLNNKLTQFKGQEIMPIITENTIRIWPQDNDTNGFYVAKLSKR